MTESHRRAETLPAPPPDLEGVRVKVTLRRAHDSVVNGRLLSGDLLTDQSVTVLLDGDSRPTIGVASRDVEVVSPSWLAEAYATRPATR